MRTARGRDRAANTGALGRIWLVLLAGLVMVVASGCRSTESGPDETTPTPTVRAPSPTPADPVAAAEQQVLAVYEGMWNAFDLAGRPPQANPDDPRLADYATGDALETLSDGLTSMRADGLVTEGEFVLAPEVTELDLESEPATAQVTDCGDSSGWRQVRADGEPYEDEPGGRRLIVADLEEGADGWRVVLFGVRELGSC